MKKIYRDVYFFGRDDGYIWAEINDNPDDVVLLNPAQCGFTGKYKDGVIDVLEINDHVNGVKYVSAKGCPRIQ